jgi:predicted component of type VI protein secretion system
MSAEDRSTGVPGDEHETDLATADAIPVVYDPHDQVHAPPPHDPSAQRAIIARILITMMALGLLIHYGAVITFEWIGKHESVKSLETILNAWLPILSGLVGAAVTYYFTHEDRKH